MMFKGRKNRCNRGGKFLSVPLMKEIFKYAGPEALQRFIRDNQKMNEWNGYRSNPHIYHRLDEAMLWSQTESGGGYWEGIYSKICKEKGEEAWEVW